MNTILLKSIFLPLLALAVQWVMWPWLKPFVWFLFFPAVFFSACLGGLWSGLISTIISIILVWYFFIPPQFSWVIENQTNLYSIVLFLVMGYLFSDSQERLRLAQQHIEAALAETRAAHEKNRLCMSEARFEAIFEQVAVGMALVATDGHWLRINHKLCRIVGHSQEELLLQSIENLIHSDNSETWRDIVRPVLAGNILTLSIERRFIRKDGNPLWINLTIALVHNPDAMPNYFIVVLENIENRKQAEEQLRKLAQAVEQSPESIVISNLEATIEYVNEAFVKNTGYTRDEVVNQNPRILQSGKTPPKTYLALWDSLINDHAWKGEFINRRKDGSEYVELAVIAPLRQPDGRISHYVAVKEDITERKQTEVALRESETKFRLLAENTTDCIFWLEPNGHYRYISPACEHIYNCSPEDFLNNPELMTNIIHPDDQEAYRLHLANHTQADQYKLEFRIQHKDGSIRWLSHYCQPMYGEDDEYLGRYGSNRDITQRKLAEISLQDSELRYRELAERSPLAIQVFSLGGETLRVNQAWEKMWGVPFSALNQYNVLQDKQLMAIGILPLLERAFSGEAVQFPNHEYDRACTEEVLHPGGKLWIHAFAYPVYDAYGKLLEVVLLQEDISERKRVENELKRRMDELERFNRAMVGRELQMIILKREINELCQAEGLPTRYVIRTTIPEKANN